MTAPLTMRPTDWALLAFLSLLWGGSFLFVGIAVKELPALTIVAARVTTAALILLVVARAMGHALPTDGRAWRDLLIMGVLANALPFSLISWGQHHIPSGLAAILNAVTPLFTTLFLHLARVERIGALRAAGLVTGLVGVAVLMGPKVTSGATIGILGAVAVMTASASYGLSGLWGRRFREVPPVVTSAGSLLGAALVTVPLSLAFDRPWTLSPGLPAVLSVAALATVSTAFAYLLFYRIMGRAGPANATLVTFLVPVTAVSLGAMFLGERLPWTAFAGMALITTGLAAIDGRPVRWLLAKLRSLGAAAPAA